MNKLSELIKQLNYADLLLIQKDLDAGNISKVLKASIKKAKQKAISLCPVCNNPIPEGHGFYLEFGDPSLRKKATFDGKDCMQYFLEHHIKR